jgi:[ribosomal protein S5]-alanine N-acetyltransferase
MLVKGTNVYLRAMRESDLEQVHQYDSDIETRGLYFPIFVDSLATFKQDFDKNGFFEKDDGSLLICDVNDDKVLGVMYFFQATPYFAGLEIGYRLYDRGNDGRGIVTEALLLCSYFLFAWQSIQRLELKIVPDNIASRRVAEKCGYQLEGIARRCIFIRGHYLDMAIYSLLRDEAPKTLDEVDERINALKHRSHSNK